MNKESNIRIWAICFTISLLSNTEEVSMYSTVTSFPGSVILPWEQSWSVHTTQFFMATAEMFMYSMANLYCQYAERQSH